MLDSFSIIILQLFQANFHLFKVNNRNTRKRCKICLKLTVKTPERCNWSCSGGLVDNFEYISQLFLVFLMLAGCLKELVINIYAWRKCFLFNIDSSDKEVTVMAPIALNILEKKPRKKHGRKLSMKQWFQRKSEPEGQ